MLRANEEHARARAQRVGESQGDLGQGPALDAGAVDRQEHVVDRDEPARRGRQPSHQLHHSHALPTRAQIRGSNALVFCERRGLAAELTADRGLRAHPA